MAMVVAIAILGAQAYLGFNLAYLLFTLIGAALSRRFPRRLPAPQSRRPLRFAVLIAARNEGRVVGSAVASVLSQCDGVPVRVAVVADHCDDDTATVAGLAG
ncbi:MAG: hypothetical protein KGR26_12095, partial [Cyanobacteria bacterium REEB65]|nr:hypothetical protein [Cyanobacteria bacterium REEB65]